MLIASSHVGMMSKEKVFPKVESSSNTKINSSSITVNFPTGYTTGDLLVICYSCYGNTVVTTPSGWTNTVGQKSALNTLEVFTRTLDGSEGSSVTISQSVGSYIAVNCYRISGGSTVEGTLITKTASAQIDPPSHTCSWGADKNLWVAVASGYGYPYVNTAPPDYSDNFIDNPNSSGGIDWSHIATGTRDYSTTATQDPSIFGGTLTGGYDWVSATLVIRSK